MADDRSRLVAASNQLRSLTRQLADLRKRAADGEQISRAEVSGTLAAIEAALVEVKASPVLSSIRDASRSEQNQARTSQLISAAGHRRIGESTLAKTPMYAEDVTEVEQAIAQARDTFESATTRFEEDQPGTTGLPPSQVGSNAATDPLFDPSKVMAPGQPSAGRWQTTGEEIETAFANGDYEFTVDTLGFLIPDQAALDRFATTGDTTLTPGERIAPQVLDTLRIPWESTDAARDRWEDHRIKQRQALGPMTSQAGFRRLEEFDAETEQLRAAKPWLMGIARKNTYGIPNVLSAREFINLPNALNDADLRRIQVVLFRAGRLPKWASNYDPEMPLSQQAPLGDRYDPDFRAAWKQLVTDWMQNQDKSLAEILDEGEEVFGPQLKAYADKIAAAKAKADAAKLANLPTTRLTDPAALRQAIDNLSTGTIGRVLDDTEKAKLVAYIHAQQRTTGNVIRQAAMEDRPVTEITDIDPQAQLAERIRDTNPVEAGAHDVASEYAMFTDLLAGPGAG